MLQSEIIDLIGHIRKTALAISGGTGRRRYPILNPASGFTPVHGQQDCPGEGDCSYAKDSICAY